MNRTIKPSEVPAMMLSGELRFGMALDCSPRFNGTVFFSGVSKTGKIIIENLYAQLVEVEKARFPLPDLRDGDPVIVHGCTHRHFHSFHPRGINCYPDGTTPWTEHVTGKAIMLFTEWRLPTEQELESSGYPGDYYTSRGCVG